MNSPRTRASRLDEHPAIRHPPRVIARLTLSLLFVLAGFASAQEWKARLLNAGDPIRSASPVPLRLEITNPTARPVEGRLESTVTLLEKPVLRHLSQPLVLVPGTQILSHMLPVIEGEPGSAREVTVRLLTSEAAFPLGTFPLRLRTERQMLVAQVSGDPAVKTPLFFPAQLPPSSHIFETLYGSGGRSPFNFSSLWLGPDDLPTQPLALCAYDFVVLHPSALAGLRPRQCEALAQWVDSGGRLVLFVSPQPGAPSPARMDTLLPFLQRLAIDQPAAKWTELPPGQVAEITEVPRLFSAGCGRVALFASPAAAESVGPAGLEFLAGASDAHGLYRSRSTADLTDVEKARRLQPSTARILSNTARPLAISTIVWAMLAFVALAAVGDYLLLGWLRQRKYTWVLFPVLAAGATATMLVVAHRHMDSLEQRGVFRIVDLGLDGRVLREIRYTAIVAPSTHPGALPAQHALLRPQSARNQFGSQQWQSFSGVIRTYDPGYRDLRLYQNRGGSGDFSSGDLGSIYLPTASAASTSSPALPAGPGVEGNVLGDSQLHVTFEQWTPLFFESYALGGTDDSGIHWDTWSPIPDGPSFPGNNEWLVQGEPITPKERDALDPSGRYTFLSKWSYATSRADGLVTSGEAVQNLYQLSIRSGPLATTPPGNSLPPMIDPQLAQNDFVLILALRQDGQNLTCYRKLQRLTPLK